MDFSLTTLYVLPNGTLASDGFKRENLKPVQFGVFNSRYKAVTTAGEAVKSPYIVFGQGRIENLPGLTHKYSDKISKGSLIEWYKTNGSPTAKNQITYAGFDGVDNTKTLSAGCDEQYSLTIRGRSLYIDAGFAYGLTRTVTVTTPCCEDCGDNCEEIDPRWLANEFARKINEEPMLSKFYVATPVFECEDAPDAPTTVATATYCVSFCDNGDDAALAVVQAQYPGFDVTRSDRTGSISSYEMVRLGTDGAPDAVVITLPVRLAVCDTCPTDYTLQTEGVQYFIERPLDGTEDLTDAAAQQTYADAIALEYAPAETFDGATDVDPATNQITVTGHGWNDGQAVTYNDGGGTAITATPAMADGGVFYVNVVDANTITLSATPGGAVVDITVDGVGAAHTLTPVVSATFVENKGGSAVILVTVDGNADELEALLSDIVTLIGDSEALCLPPAGTEVEWTACDTGFKVQRTLSLTITDDCSSDLEAIQAAYPDYTVTLEESANCNSRYELVQTSDNIQDDCDFSIPPKFVDVQPYKGIEWIVVADALTGSGCQAGVKIEGKPLDKYGNPCDPIAFPYEYDKLTFEVFAYKGAPTSQDFLTYDRCDNIPITTTQRSTYVTGSGAEIFELEKRYNSYQSTGVGKHIYHNATWNGGFVRYSDPTAFYDTYVITFKSPDLNTWDNVSRQDETVIIAVPVGTGGQLETFLLGYFGEEKFTAGVLSV